MLVTANASIQHNQHMLTNSHIIQPRNIDEGSNSMSEYITSSQEHIICFSICGVKILFIELKLITLFTSKHFSVASLNSFIAQIVRVKN